MKDGTRFLYGRGSARMPSYSAERAALITEGSWGESVDKYEKMWKSMGKGLHDNYLLVSLAHLITQHGPEVAVHVDPGQRPLTGRVELVEAVERHDRLLAHVGL